MPGPFFSISTFLSTARGVALENGSFCELQKVAGHCDFVF
jgi:hypothetical protein